MTLLTESLAMQNMILQMQKNWPKYSPEDRKRLLAEIASMQRKEEGD